MSLLRLTPTALAHSRFALSPMAETLASAILLSRACVDPWIAPWHARHHAAYLELLAADPFARGLVALVGSTKWLPTYVTFPPEGGMRTALAGELARLAAVPDERVREDLARSVEHSWQRHDLGWLTGRDLAPRTAELLGEVWRRHIAADWPRRRALLERDVTYRAGLLAAYGWPRALERMNKFSAWVGADQIRFTTRPGPVREVGEAGLLFVPVSACSGTWLGEAPSGRYALVYPARGTGAEQAALPAERPPGALDRLIGRGRAAVLRELERPATSSELAAQLGVSLGTIGGHLAVLRDAELVTNARVGRRVVYRRTAAGDQLAGERPR
ncbi:helix-turn-helix domain-containing protein [Kitasatospora sp. NPDC002227]|uniref:ArsR/SmtB family transcription factor n=1 Tax=Kitasatospora sp. NPDC002227 TaxID=3154773 RepID=UPI00332D4932